MWLLSTDRAELHHFPSPELVPGGYAILSHTWDDHEQSFKDTQDIANRWMGTGVNPRDCATPKVRESCILAERHGYRWIWNDTCCIDKTSSTELSEAINSMFRWYSLAEVCFAYMADVESDCVLSAEGSAFRTARWHFRGWTLQELIAPSLVVFVSEEWEILGNKVELAPLLQEITGVPSQVLTREEHYSLPSIAERMSWASKRSTTRVEDEAYCLMGLFNVNMPTIYGEGRQAFQRLQYEIVKQSFDTSLFIWGGSTRSAKLAPVDPQGVYELLNTSTQNHIYLLADSPKSFSKPWGRTVRYTPATADPLQPYLDWQRKTDRVQNALDDKPDASVQQQLRVPFGGVELPRFSITSYGLKCRLPIIESDGLTVAVLLCDNGREHLGLFLHPSKDPVQGPSRKKYNTGYGFQNVGAGYSGFVRLTSLGDDLSNLQLNGKVVTTEWRDIFIADSPPPIERDVTPSLCSRLHSIAPAPPFRFPHWLISKLAMSGMVLQRLDIHSKPIDGKPLHASATFEDINTKEGIRLVFGTCVDSAESSDGPSHWAKAIPQSAANWRQGVDDLHDCLEHHIGSWPSWIKDFGDAERTVRLSFSRCKLTPSHTLAVHIQLEGRTYERFKYPEIAMPPSREECEDSTGPGNRFPIEFGGSFPNLFSNERVAWPEPYPGSDEWDLSGMCRAARESLANRAAGSIGGTKGGEETEMDLTSQETGPHKRRRYRVKAFIRKRLVLSRALGDMFRPSNVQCQM